MNKLPPDIPIEKLETRRVLKKLNGAHKALAELKGVSETIPNEEILIDTLSLQEAKDSSEIENIITTHDEIYMSDFRKKQFSTLAAKEVHSYAEALKTGFREVQEKGIITTNKLIRIQQIIKENNAGVRAQPGTKLTNSRTGEVIYEPPQDKDTIMDLLDNLEWFINEKDVFEADELVKMALIHHQFESIHPFYDGNGRVGRILNILYLVQYNLLTLPILYISRYIIQNRQEYYKHLQETRDAGHWETWVLYMLDAVETTANETILKIASIRELMQEFKHKIRKDFRNIYSQDLINNLFRQPYTRIPSLQAELNVSRGTAWNYLETLNQAGLLSKVKIKGKSYYINEKLFDVLSRQEETGPNQNIVEN